MPKWAIASTLTRVGAASLIYHYKLPLCDALQALGVEIHGGSAPSYYDTLPRLWEVLAGGLVCCLPALPSRRCCGAAAALGLLAVLLPAVAGSLPGTAWLSALPSTLTVVAGTVLTLRYAPDTLTGCLLNSRALLWLGRISFSVYLVHMPLIVFGKLWVFGEAGTGLQVGLLVGSFLLGWLYWLAVEKRRFPWWLLVLVWLAALMLGRAARKSNGFSSIVPLPSITWAAYDNWHICTRENLCSPWPAELIPNSEVFYFMKTKAVTPHPVLMSVGDPAETPSFVLMGDSHAMCTYSGLSEALRGEKSGVYMTSIIMPFADYTTLKNKTYFFTPKKQKALMQWLEAHPELRYVIIAQRWTMRLTKIPNAEAKLQQFLCELKAIGKQPILIAPYPEYSASNTLHYQRTAVLQGLTFEDISPSHTREEYAAYNRRELDILQRMESQGLCTLIKPADALSEGERFHASKGDVSYMVDTDHLSPAGSIWFMQMLRGKLLEALSK